MVNTVNADGLRNRNGILLRMRLEISYQNTRMDAGSKNSRIRASLVRVHRAVFSRLSYRLSIHKQCQNLTNASLTCQISVLCRYNVFIYSKIHLKEHCIILHPLPAAEAVCVEYLIIFVLEFDTISIRYCQNIAISIRYRYFIRK